MSQQGAGGAGQSEPRHGSTQPAPQGTSPDHGTDWLGGLTFWPEPEQPLPGGGFAGSLPAPTSSGQHATLHVLPPGTHLPLSAGTHQLSPQLYSVPVTQQQLNGGVVMQAGYGGLPHLHSPVGLVPASLPHGLVPTSSSDFGRLQPTTSMLPPYFQPTSRQGERVCLARAGRRERMHDTCCSSRGTMPCRAFLLPAAAASHHSAFVGDAGVGPSRASCRHPRGHHALHITHADRSAWSAWASAFGLSRLFSAAS